MSQERLGKSSDPSGADKTIGAFACIVRHLVAKTVGPALPHDVSILVSVLMTSRGKCLRRPEGPVSGNCIYYELRCASNEPFENLNNTVWADGLRIEAEQVTFRYEKL